MPGTYRSRQAEDYITALRRVLAIEHLLDSAVELPPDHYARSEKQPPEHRYKHRCDIAFVGISATNLFDRTCADNAWRAMAELFKAENRQRFIDRHIWLRVRLLLLYPYSTHAMSIINAETSTRRTAIEEPRIHPSVQRNLHVAEDEFYGSSLYRSQKDTLKVIQEWLDDSSVKNRDGNSIEVRFTPVSPNLCGLIVNEKAFCDSYILAKTHRWSRHLVFASPLVELDRTEDDFAFRALEDHFRYLWQLNITVDAQDATQYDPTSPKPKQDSLSKINRPSQISFTAKANRLSNKTALSRDRQPLDHDDVKEWIPRTKQQFRRYVTLPVEDSPNEQVFISCCWEDEDASTRARTPNALAQNLRDWLYDDITKPGTPTFDAQILQGAIGESLPDRLYGMMNTSLLGIVLLTPAFRGAEVGPREGVGSLVWPADVPSPGSTVPARTTLASINVYHELGYLMSQLDREDERSAGKVFLGVQSGVEIPSNVSHLFSRSIKPLSEADLAAIQTSVESAYLRDTKETPVATAVAATAQDEWQRSTDERIREIGLTAVSWHLYLSVLQWLDRTSTLAKHDREMLKWACDKHLDRIDGATEVPEGLRKSVRDLVIKWRNKRWATPDATSQAVRRL